MRITYLLLLIALPVFINAQVKDCRQSNEFTAIQAYDGIIVSLEHGEEAQLCAGTDTDLDELQISIENNILRIRKVAGTKYEKQPKVRVIYTNIRSIEAFGKADLDTRNLIKTDSLTIIMKSGSRFYADCDVKHLTADISEGSLLKIDGYAVNQDITSAGKATFGGFELQGETATVRATRGGIIKLNIEKKITGTSSSTGYVSYKNSPKVSVKASMGGKLVKNED